MAALHHRPSPSTMFAPTRTSDGLNKLCQAVSQVSSEPPLAGDDTRNIQADLIDDIAAQTEELEDYAEHVDDGVDRLCEDLSIQPGVDDIELSLRMAKMATQSDKSIFVDGQNKKAKTMLDSVKDASKEVITPKTRMDYERSDMPCQGCYMIRV